MSQANSVTQPAGSRRAMSTARWRYHAGHGAVLFAIRLPRGRRAAAEIKIRVPRIAGRPAAGSFGERPDFFGESGCLDARWGGLLQRRLDEERSRWRRFGAAVRPGGNRDGGLLDLVNRDCLHSQEPEHNADAMRDAAVTGSPPPDVPGADAEPLGGTALGDAEGAERRAEFSRNRGVPMPPPPAGRCFLPFRGARVDGDRHYDVPDLDLDLDQVASGLRCAYRRNRGAPQRRGS